MTFEWPEYSATDGPNNKTRAQWALESLEVFATNTSSLGNLLADPHEVLSDLLCNLEHWANQNDVNFDDCVARGNGHFLVEFEEES